MTLSPLDGVRILDCSLLGPAALTAPLVELGADVIKVEAPGGDYGREMTWPIIDGISLLFLHANRGKRSIVIDLRTQDGVTVFKDLARSADAVVEAMRPGALSRRGVGYEDLRAINPKIVFCTLSGYGMTGPYKDMPSHGIAYDTWAGIVKPQKRDDGHWVIGEHVSIGINAGPLYGALALCAGIIRARATGEGAYFDIAQSDAAAAFDWYEIESYKAYERPAPEVTGNKADNYERRPVATAGMKEGVRYQVYETKDSRHVLFMASEQAFWKNFCAALDRMDLFDRWPGSKFADHARNNLELQNHLRDIFLSKNADEWITFGDEVNTPIAPVNNPTNLQDDPQFEARLGWIPREVLGADQLPSPIRVVEDKLPSLTKAPQPGQHTDEVLRDVLGYDQSRIADLRDRKIVG